MKWILALMLGCTAAAAPSAGTVALVTSASWGTLILPAGGNTTVKLDPLTGLVSVTSGGGVSTGVGVAATYLVTGNLFQNISYSGSIGSFSGTGVSATATYVNGTSSSGSANLGAVGTMLLRVGGLLEVSPSASEGTHSATITVTVNFL